MKILILVKNLFEFLKGQGLRHKTTGITLDPRVPLSHQTARFHLDSRASIISGEILYDDLKD